MASTQSYLEKLIEAIQVPDSKYEAANRTFNSICDWMQRPASTLREAHIESYLQGSFRLGTAIRPTTEDDDYDLDIVVALKFKKSSISQAQLKYNLGVEVKAYSKAHSMSRPSDARRCWTQDYADGSQFHVDILPAIPDQQGLQEKLVSRGLQTDFVESSIAITDQKNVNYRTLSWNWPNSNPKGFAAWFEARMGGTLQRRKEAIALTESRAVEDIPTYRARVPLQKAVQLLKFHRDRMFADDPDDRPISIIITTLAAKAYRGEMTLEDALQTILRDMHLGIETELGIDWIRNPTNALENFADKWIEYPKRRDNFYKWLDAARADFARLAILSRENAKHLITEMFGEEVYAQFEGGSRRYATTIPIALLQSNHKQAPPWDPLTQGTVKIHRATMSAHGFRTKAFSSNSFPIPKNQTLMFFARTDIPAPYQVYWQVVNTGEQAYSANCLRGGFDTGAVFSGYLKRKESSLYSGSHSIECFIVKDGYLAGRSGPFVVNIK